MSHTHSYVSLPLTECLQWRGGSRSKTKKKNSILTNSKKSEWVVGQKRGKFSGYLDSLEIPVASTYSYWDS